MNHRSEQRIAAGESGKATILGHPDVTVSCHIRDYSKSGLCIVVDHFVASGKIVKVEWNDHFLVGRVRTVAATRSHFRVGLELLYCSKWNESMTALFATAAREAITSPSRV